MDGWMDGWMDGYADLNSVLQRDGEHSFSQESYGHLSKPSIDYHY